MDRYIVKISFKQKMFERVTDIVYTCKTLKQAEEASSLIDNTVDKALIKDNVTGKVIWIKE